MLNPGIDRTISRGVRAGGYILVIFLAHCLVVHAEPIKVAIYNHSGDTARGPKNLKRLLDDSSRFQCETVTPEGIRENVLEGFDLLIVPGGSASKQANLLEESGRDRVREFVRQGGGYMGICAGAYLASSDYPWSLHILNAKVIDRAHWARGTGQARLTLTLSGQSLLKEQENVEVYYGQGPLLGPDTKDSLPAYESLATYASEIAEKGAPQGVMVGTTAIARTAYGQGRVICFSPHCEVSGGPNEMIIHAVLWVTKRDEESVSSSSDSVLE